MLARTSYRLPRYGISSLVHGLFTFTSHDLLLLSSV